MTISRNVAYMNYLDARDNKFDPYETHRDNPFDIMRLMRQVRPVFYSPELSTWCVTRYDDIVTVLRDTHSFSARDHNPRPAKPLPPDVKEAMTSWRGSARPMGSLDPPEHTKVRAAVNAGFTRGALKKFEPGIRETARSLIIQAIVKPEFEFMDEFSLPYAVSAVLQVLGVPLEFSQRCRWWHAQRMGLMLGREPVNDDQLRDRARALKEYGAFFRELTVARQIRPVDDLISSMLHDQQHGHRLSLDEIAAQVPTLISAGLESTAHILATLVWRQLKSAGGWAAVVSGNVLIPNLVEEGLRFDPPFFGTFRTALRDVTLSGVRLPPGSRILLLYGSGNHDEGRFQTPEMFDSSRQPTTPHLAFGFGPHFCIGASLARMELQIALEELVDLAPALSLADPSPSYQPIFPIRALAALRVRA